MCMNTFLWEAFFFFSLASTSDNTPHTDAPLFHKLHNSLNTDATLWIETGTLESFKTDTNGKWTSDFHQYNGHLPAKTGERVGTIQPETAISTSAEQKTIVGEFRDVRDSLNVNGTMGQFHITINDCTDKTLAVLYDQGFITGIDSVNMDILPDLNTCQWRVIVPIGLFILASIEMDETCTKDMYIQSSEDDRMDGGSLLSDLRCGLPMDKQIVATLSNCLYFCLGNIIYESDYLLRFRVHIQVTRQSYRLTLPVVYESLHSGYVTSPGFAEDRRHPRYMNATVIVRIPENEVVMISFHILDVGDDKDGECRDIYVAILTENVTGIEQVELKGCSSCFMTASVHSQSLIIRFVTNDVSEGIGFKLFFSFHSKSQSLHKTDNGLFDCAVPHFPSFKRHLECNLKSECEGGIDEMECEFRSPVYNGSVVLRNRRYTYHFSEIGLSWNVAQTRCQGMGGTLVMPKTTEQINAVEKLFHYKRRNGPAHIGLRPTDTDMPAMYKYTYQWVDGTIGYSANITSASLGNQKCAQCSPCFPFSLEMYACTLETLHEFICESEIRHTVPTAEKYLQFPRQVDLFSSEIVSNYSLFPCKEGHVSRDYLSCSPQSACGETRYLKWCHVSNNIIRNISSNDTSHDVKTRTSTFACSDKKRTIPYSLVCDFRFHCIDRSDEDFCTHDTCSEVSCANQQCISYGQICDDVEHCFDGSDEKSCSDLHGFSYFNLRTLPPPVIIKFDNTGKFIQTQLQLFQPCPPTHFRCYGESSNCLPVYVRCNGVYDCPDLEDEVGCDRYTCPGFYRCFNSRICVHVNNMCDGMAQCPEGDDELLCRFRCPDNCQCQGLSFICRRKISGNSFPKLRYLDADESGMSVNDVATNMYLIWLSLKHCHIVHITEMSNRNLMVLDLSDNEISFIDMNVFLNLKRLTVLTLSGNPLISLSSGMQVSEQHFLENVDISVTAIKVFSSTSFRNYPRIISLNVSHSAVEEIDNSSFFYMPGLQLFDARYTPLSVFPRNLFHDLRYLKTVFAGNYRLCCEENLPEQFNKESCFSDIDIISSCRDLLQSTVSRILLWCTALLAVVGNAACLIVLHCDHTGTLKSGHAIFISNLNVADFLMGIYLSIVGAADHIYRHVYYSSEIQWKASIACKIAGFLAFLSTEVSFLTIGFIMLDRFLVLSVGLLQFKARSVSLICGIAWCVGAIFAVIPLLPMTSHWAFYGQTAICAPLLVLPSDGQISFYTFSVMIVTLNLTLFIVTALGQTCVSLSMRKMYLTTDTTQIAQDKNVARRSTAIVVSKIVCWLVIGSANALVVTGVFVSGEIRVGVTFVLIPLNSALNPFLYFLGVHSERRRVASETQLSHWLMARAGNVRKKNVNNQIELLHSSGEKGLTEQGALRVFGENLRDAKISLTDIRICPETTPFRLYSFDTDARGKKYMNHP